MELWRIEKSVHPELVAYNVLHYRLRPLVIIEERSHCWSSQGMRLAFLASVRTYVGDKRLCIERCLLGVPSL